MVRWIVSDGFNIGNKMFIIIIICIQLSKIIINQLKAVGVLSISSLHGRREGVYSHPPSFSKKK